MNRLLDSKILFLTAAIIIRFLLDISYVYFINPVFAYSGFLLNFTLEQYLVSWALYLSGLIGISHQARSISDYFHSTALFGLIAPLTSMYGLDQELDIFPVITTIISILFISFLSKSNIIPAPKIFYIKNGNFLATKIAASSVAFLILWYIYTGAAFNMNFDFSKVYDFREENSQITNIGLLSYFNSWVYQVFNIFLLLIFLQKKQYGGVTIVVLIELFFYGITNQKSVAFYPFLIIAIWYYFLNRKSLIFLPVLFSVIIAFSLLKYIVYEDINTGSMFIRRVFFIPSDLTFSYFEFFSSNRYVYWSNSILSNFISYPYGELSLARTIGEYRGTGAGDNNGYISSGFAHAGLFGVFLYSILIAYLLKILNSLSKAGIPLWFPLGLTAIPIRALILSSDFLVVMLTHGFLISIILLILIRRNSQNS